MSTLSSANVTDVNLVFLKERTHMRLCTSMLIFTHNLGNWLREGMEKRRRALHSPAKDAPEKACELLLQLVLGCHWNVAVPCIQFFGVCPKNNGRKTRLADDFVLGLVCCRHCNE